MDTNISREDAIKNIGSLLRWIQGDNIGRLILNPAYIESLIMALESLTGSRAWIPVSERFPDEDCRVLLSFENYNDVSIGRYEYDFLEDSGAFYLMGDPDSCASQGIVVNAWMPLPEPYREE